MEHDLLTATTAEGHDTTDVAATAHDITTTTQTATTGAEHDKTNVAATAHDTTDVAAVERDSTTATMEGSATPAAAPDGHASRPVSYVSVPPDVWAVARADIARYRRDSLGGKGWDKRKDTPMRAKGEGAIKGDADEDEKAMR